MRPLPRSQSGFCLDNLKRFPPDSQAGELFVLSDGFGARCVVNEPVRTPPLVGGFLPTEFRDVTRTDLVAWIIPKDVLSLVFSTLGVV